MNASLPDGRRTAATWIAATGAFLLVAAASLFVAVRWEDLPDAAKLGVLTVITVAALAGGRLLQASLPATGSVVFHLGAFLVPVDVAAAMLRLDLDWRSFLLVESLASVASFVALASVSKSPVLRWAGAGSGVVVAAGVAAVSLIPAPLLLAVAAVAALAAGEERVATAWAGVAGLAPIAGAGVAAAIASAGGSLGLGVLQELGLSGQEPVALLAGVAAAGALASIARRLRSLLHAFLGLGALATSALVSWLSVVDRGSSDAVAAAAAFLGVELAALAAQRDPFWRRIAEPFAIATEAVVAVVTLPMLGVAVLLAPIADIGFDFLTDAPGWSPEPALGAAAAVGGLAWFAVGLRITPPRRTRLWAVALDVLGHPLTVLPIALSFGAAVAVGTASPARAAVSFAAVSLAAAGTGRPFAVVVGVGFGAWLAATAADPFGWAAASMLSVVVLWVAASFADQDSDTARLGNIARAGLVTPLMIGLSQPAGESFVVSALAVVLLAADAWRFSDQRIAVAAILTAQLPLSLGAHLAGFDVAGVGLVLCGVAVVAAGLGTITWPTWSGPTVVAVVAPLILGVSLASVEESAFGSALLVAGGIAIVAAPVSFEWWLAYLGGAVVAAGMAVHLNVAGVQSSEPYLAPIALQLVVLGWHLRRTRPLSSWVAYGPATALLGGAALVERLGGGGAWHAVVAAGVGVVAVSAGGWLRLVGPLMLGTALLVVVTVYESLATLATVPTWAWLAAGGALLLSVGVALERTGTAPVEAGRRVADVLADRFD